MNMVNNVLGETEDHLNFDQALNGHFPWINGEDNDGIFSHSPTQCYHIITKLTTVNSLYCSLMFLLLDKVPLRAKRKAVEIYLTGKRLEEEILLLEKEMIRFLCYYRDKVIPDLSSRLDSLDGMFILKCVERGIRLIQI
jgi:hypothetical protein